MTSRAAWSVQLESVDFGEFLSSLVAADSPGVALGVALAGEPIFTGAAGLADISTHQPLTPTTGMAIGSCTKHLTCLAYLLLCERGRAALDDPVGRYIPELHPHARPATVRQLMGHLSGLRDAAELSMLFDGFDSHVPLAAILDLYRTIGSLEAPPGERWSYNNGGYLLLSAILERVYHAPLELIFTTEIFTPAGLADSYLQRYDENMPAARARLYRKSGPGFVETRRSVEGLGQGGVTSSVTDLLRWLGHIASPFVGSSESWATMTTSMRLNSGAVTGYGAGLRIGRYRGLDLLHHPGAVPGGNAHMLKVPALGLDIVVLANREDISAIDVAHRLLDMSVVGLDPKPEPAGALPIEGVFRSTRGGRTVRLKAPVGSQRLILDGTDLVAACDPSGDLRPLVAGLFRAESVQVDPSLPDQLRIDVMGARETLRRVAPIGRKRGWCRRFHAGGLTLDIDTSAAPPVMRAIGPVAGAAYNLVPIGDRLWEAHARGTHPMHAVVALDDDGSLHLSNLRVRELVLEPVESQR